MAFFKWLYNHRNKLYYPRAIVKGKPIESEELAELLSDKCTLTAGDIMAVLWNLPFVMHYQMKNGKSIHLERLGYFRLGLDTTGESTYENIDFDNQKDRVSVCFSPERYKDSNGNYASQLVNSSTIEWIDLTDYTELAASVASATSTEENSSSESSETQTGDASTEETSSGEADSSGTEG